MLSANEKKGVSSASMFDIEIDLGERMERRSEITFLQRAKSIWKRSGNAAISCTLSLWYGVGFWAH